MFSLNSLSKILILNIEKSKDSNLNKKTNCHIRFLMLLFGFGILSSLLKVKISQPPSTIKIVC